MVVQRTIENLRQRPKEDRKAVASGVAIAAGVIIFIVWSFFFVRSFNPGTLTEGAQKAYSAAASAADVSNTIEVNGDSFPQ